MRASPRNLRLPASMAVACALALSACATNNANMGPPGAGTSGSPPLPSIYQPEQLVGRWGYGAYHKDEDRARTENAARGQCGQPVIINRGPSGGIMMYLADSAQLQELVLKGSQSGKNFVGPPGDAGGPQDREIVSLDGRTMILRWVDQEVAGRYGTGVYVRCAPEGVARAAGKPPMTQPAH